MSVGRQRGQVHPGQVGLLAEEAVKKYLERLGRTVQDVRKDPLNMWRDIDFIVSGGTRTEYVEVKGDTWLHKSGNLFLEVKRDHEGPGCFFRSKADTWYYVDAETGDTLILPLSAVQAWLAWNNDRAKKTSTRSHRKGGFVQFHGYLVPAEVLVQELGIQRIALPLG